MFIRRALVLMLGVVLMATTVATVAAESTTMNQDGSAESNSLQYADSDPRPFARLEIGEGSKLIFYAMLANGEDPGDDGRRDQIEIISSVRDERRDVLRGIGMAQYIPAGGMDPMSVPELRDANPYEIFYALSEHGTEIPRVFREFYNNQFARADQGWALGKIKPGIFKLLTCENTEQVVADAVATTGLPYSYNELSEGPHNGPFWYAQDPNQLFPTYYKNNGLATVGDAYFHVMLCEEDAAFSFTSIDVRLAYEESDDGQVLSSGELYWQLHNPGDQVSFMSWPFDSDMSGDNSWFWMLTIEDVFYYDTLHIGTAWS